MITGGEPVAEALSNAAQTLDWQVVIESNYGIITGLMAGLSRLDCAVIMGHDVESSSRCLASALESDAGYIGASHRCFKRRRKTLLISTYAMGKSLLLTTMDIYSSGGLSSMSKMHNKIFKGIEALEAALSVNQSKE